MREIVQGSTPVDWGAGNFLRRILLLLDASHNIIPKLDIKLPQLQKTCVYKVPELLLLELQSCSINSERTTLCKVAMVS